MDACNSALAFGAGTAVDSLEIFLSGSCRRTFSTDNSQKKKKN